MKTTRIFGSLIAFCLVSGSSVALADYQTEQDNKHMGAIERAIAKFKENPAIFDGTAIRPGQSVPTVNNHVNACVDSINAWNRYEKYIKKSRSTPRFQKILARIRVLNSHCRKLHGAGKTYIAGIQAKEQAAAKAKSDLAAKCLAMRSEALKATGTSLHEILEVWAGSMTLATAEHVTDYRKKLNKLVPVCTQAKYENIVTECKGQGMIQTTSNKRFDYGDICAPAVDADATMRKVAMNLLNLMVRHSTRENPTAESFRKKDGWIRDVNPVYYEDAFKVTAETKKSMEKQINEAFGAAGVSPPEDMSVVWAKKQEYLDALKVAVDATASEWKLGEKKCKGYACGLAKKGIKKRYKGASVKGVYGRDWKIAKNALDIPTHKYQGLWVIFKVHGEKYCQVRAMTATETYKGGGRYQRAKGAAWGYARFQTSCK